MTYTKKQFGLGLKEKVTMESSCKDISQWAFQVYTDYGLDFEEGLDLIVLKLIAMEEGPEFVLSRSEIIRLSDECIA